MCKWYGTWPKLPELHGVLWGWLTGAAHFRVKSATLHTTSDDSNGWLCLCTTQSCRCPCSRATNEKTLLTCRKCLWSQSTYEPSIMCHCLIPVWDASLGLDPFCQVWRYTRNQVFPIFPHRFLPIFHFSAVNIPLREALEQLFTHKSHTATWQHPSQVFLPQSKAKDNPQRKPSGSFFVQMHPRHPGTCVFCRQPQPTQLVSPGLLTN